MSGQSGQELYQIVDTYTGLGWHRTGSDTDRLTAQWFADELSSRGLGVNSVAVEYERWDTDSRLRIESEDVEHLALETPWIGEVDTGAPLVESIDPRSGGLPTIVDGPLRAAALSGADALVLATEHPNGSLVGINREPEAASTPAFPAVLVAGRDLEACRQGDVHLELRARRVPGMTTNVVGERSAGGSPIVLTTPLTGWFGCAGERGTGLAVLLALIDRLPDVPLTVVGTGGHELGFFGAYRYVRGCEAPQAVVHIGASIAVEEDDPDGGRRLASTRVAMTTLQEGVGDRVAKALDRARLSLAFAASSWIGEANAWNMFGMPMLSISGAGVDFHTPEDTPSRATSPAALAVAADAVVEATQEFLSAVGRRGG